MKGRDNRRKVSMPGVLSLGDFPLTEKRCSYFSSERTHAVVTSTMELGQFHILQDDAWTTPTALNLPRSHDGTVENSTPAYLARVTARWLFVDDVINGRTSIKIYDSFFFSNWLRADVTVSVRCARFREKIFDKSKTGCQKWTLNCRNLHAD